MKPTLTWEALDGVIHAVLEDTTDGFMPPHALILACTVDVTLVHGKSNAFGHIISSEIRAADRRVPVTCLLCLAYCSRS